MNKEPIFPSDVFAAIAEAKRRDPGDKYGDNAFRVDLSNIQDGKNNVRYVGFEVLRRRGEKWDYIPLNLNFMKLHTMAGIYPPGHEKKKFAGAKLQFIMEKSTFERRNITEDYGKAKLAIYQAFARIIKSLLKKKLLFNGNVKIASGVQTDRVVDKKSRAREALEEKDYIIRVDIPFNKTTEGGVSIINPEETSTCDIYDAEKQIPKVKPGVWPLEKATLNGKKLTYSNIGEFITYGSVCSGTDCMDRVCLSSQGISLPSKVILLTVKRSRGFKPDPQSIFGEYVNEFISAEPISDENEEEAKTVTELADVVNDADGGDSDLEGADDQEFD